MDFEAIRTVNFLIPIPALVNYTVDAGAHFTGLSIGFKTLRGTFVNTLYFFNC